MKYGILVPIVRQPFPLPLHPRIQLGAWIRRTHRDIGRVEMCFVDEFLQPFPSVRRFGASAHDKAAGNTDAVGLNPLNIIAVMHRMPGFEIPRI